MNHPSPFGSRPRLHARLLAPLLVAFLLATHATAENVVFSEIHYHPADGRPEYIEIQNLSLTPYDIADWRFSDGVDYRFPQFSSANPTWTFLKHHERILVTGADPQAFRQAYGVPAAVRIYGPWTGNLADGGERVTLKDKNGVVVVTVNYRDNGRWPLAADGHGPSLVLVNPDRPVDDWRNWKASARPGGTPGTTPVVLVEESVPNAEISLIQGVPLVDYASVWRYNDTNTDLGTAWREKNYNDAAWPSGPGLLGFETAPLPAPGLATGLTRGNQLTYYFRSRFQFSGDPNGAVLTIDQILDDGAVYWLNGVRIGSSGMPLTEPTFTTPATVTISDAVEQLGAVVFTNTAAGPLVEGENTLAVEAHQANTGSSDLVFGMRLRSQVRTRSGVVINEVLPHPAQGFIEFYNPGASPVNLRGYWLSDEAGRLAKHAITQDLLVPAGGFATVGNSVAPMGQGPIHTWYLTAPDGVTVVNGFSAPIPADGRSLGRKPAGGPQWFLFPDATPNAANGTLDNLAASIRLSEIHLAGGRVDWVELANLSDEPVVLDGLTLATKRDGGDGVVVNLVVPARGQASVATDFEAGGGALTLRLASPNGMIFDIQEIRPRAGYASMQRFPLDGDDWYATTSATRDLPNQPDIETRVVLNEIMFNPPGDHLDGEFVELHNRSNEAVDLSGWAFVEGIDFTIPPGTVVAPGGFLVVAANADRMRSVYGDIPVVGDYSGRLSNDGELVRLVDARGNLVDEVDYKGGGDWPEWSRGGGGSMELAHPALDNRLASAWRDSDESQTSSFKSHTVSGRYLQINSLGGPTSYKEIFLHLVGDSHVILRDIELVRQGTTQNLLTNAGLLSSDAFSSSGWLCQGTHWQSHFQGQDFHLISTGRGDNRPNRVELDALGLVANQNFEIRFKARWVRGNPRLIVQTWDHSIAGSVAVEIPLNLGTPGRTNSAYAGQIPPQLERLEHTPAVPNSSQSVVVAVDVHAPVPLRSVQLFHRADNANRNGTWQSKTMVPAAAGQARHSAMLTEHQVNGRIVEFFVRAETVEGGVYFLPKEGLNAPALYVVDNQTPPSDMRQMRFVISQYHREALENGGTAKFNHKFPRLQNNYFNATMIVNERDVIYNAGLRNSGSPWTRGDLSRGKFKLPDDRRFRGRYKFTYDNDAAGQLSHNRMTRQMLYYMGHVVNENELIRFSINRDGFTIKEETEAIDNDFLNRNFEHGTKGDLYRIDDEWWFDDSWNRNYRNADWLYKGTDNPGRYRTEWMKRTIEDEDDFTALIAFFQTISGGYTQSQIERMIDPHMVQIMSAVRGYIQDWDSFSLNRGKNGWFYRRATDGLFQFLHWDSDLAFGDANGPLISGVGGFSTWAARPYNSRLFYGYLVELLEQYTLGSDRMAAWLQAEEDASPSYTARASFYRTWFTNRDRYARGVMGGNYTRPLALSNSQVSTTEETVTLIGTAPYGMLELRVEGHPEAQVSWTTAVGFSIQGIRVRQGESELTVTGLGVGGRVKGQVVARVTKPNNAPPLAVLEMNPKSGHLPLPASALLNGSDSRDPEGGALEFQWALLPAEGGRLAPLPGGMAEASFFRPGVYTVSLTVRDPEGNSSTVAKDLAVFDPAGFTSFDGAWLAAPWKATGTAPRENFSPSGWYSLVDIPGWLQLQVLADQARPAVGVEGSHPWIHRELPSQGDWSLHTKVKLDTRQSGAFQTGLLVEFRSAVGLVQYALGMEQGNSLSVRKLENGQSILQSSIAWAQGEAALRARRMGNTLRFEALDGTGWRLVHSQEDISFPATRGGLFLSTSIPLAMRVAFDYALLVDNSGWSLARRNLRLSEIMYNPPGGDDFEFLELLNIGSEPIELGGFAFTTGVAHTFQNRTLAGGESVVVARNRAAFLSRYPSAAASLAQGEYTGRLDNGGELLTLVDAAGEIIFAIAYGDSGDWPGRADGDGSSLELADLAGDPNEPGRWRPSSEYLGSPGVQGQGPVRTVRINELLAHSDPPYEDAIELFNRTASTIDIGGWYLTDNRADLKRFRIPSPTLLPPQGHVVFYETQFKTNNPLVPFSLNSAEGDSLLLVSADAADNLVSFVDSIDFGPTENGVTLGRHPNGEGPLVAMSRQTLGTDVQPHDSPSRADEFRAGKGAPNAYPKVGPVVFAEVMYQPGPGGDEFLRFINNSASPVNLFDPASPENRWRVTDGVAYTFPPNITLQPGESIYLAAIDPQLFRSKYEIPVSTKVVGPYVGALNNAGEFLELSKPDRPQPAVGGLPPLVPYILVERFAYSPVAPWPSAAAGFGPSLKRKNSRLIAADPTNWTTDSIDPSFDRDADGMPNEWEEAHGLNPDDPADAELDLDGDGHSNLMEYLAGTSPTDPLSVLAIGTTGMTGDGFELHFPTSPGKSYLIQSRPAFDPASGWTTFWEVKPGNAPVSLLDARDRAQTQFYRIQVK